MGEQGPRGLSANDEQRAKNYYKSHKELNTELEAIRAKLPEIKLPQETVIKVKDALNAIDALYGSEGLSREAGAIISNFRKEVNGNSELFGFHYGMAADEYRASDNEEDSRFWAREHYGKNEEAYKQQAVNDATEAGKDVNYPGYSPETPPPPPPAPENPPNLGE